MSRAAPCSWTDATVLARRDLSHGCYQILHVGFLTLGERAVERGLPERGDNCGADAVDVERLPQCEVAAGALPQLVGGTQQASGVGTVAPEGGHPRQPLDRQCDGAGEGRASRLLEALGV